MSDDDKVLEDAERVAADVGAAYVEAFGQQERADRLAAIMDESAADARALLKRVRDQDPHCDPDRILVDMMDEALRVQHRLACAPAVGSAESIVAAVEQVKPAGVRLVAVVVNGVPNVPRWWWRWAEPVALWLLERAGYEVCR